MAPGCPLPLASSGMPAGPVHLSLQVLEEAGLLKGAVEIVFYGIDRGTQVIRDNSGIVSGGLTGTVEPDAGGGLDLTITEQFARSMSLDDALDPRNLLCYEMNGEPLPEKNGFPIRLIAPGWYGVANVKWLTRIEVRNQRHAGNYMARDYVTIREEQRNGQPLWTFSTVRHDRLKSAPARVVRRGSRYVVLGAAWGAPIAAVEVRIDNGPWLPARLFGPVAHNRNRRGLAWRFWTFGWGMPASGPAHGDVQGIRRRRQRAAGAGRSVPCQQSDLLGEQRTHHTPGSHSLIATTVAIGRSEAGGHRIGAAAARYRPRDRTLVVCGQAGVTPSRFKTRDATPHKRRCGDQSAARPFLATSRQG